MTIKQQIFDLYTQGAETSEVVRRFGISPHTAATYHISWRKANQTDGNAAHAGPKQHQAEVAIKLLNPTGLKEVSVLELFAGEQGYMTNLYRSAGCTVESLDRLLGTGDSFQACYERVASRKTYTIVDADPYGYPWRLFPHVFLLIDDGALFFTMPKVGVMRESQMTRQMRCAYSGKFRPDLEDILDRLWWYAVCHWREVSLLDALDLGKVWRVSLRVKRVKATEFCGVRNQAGAEALTPEDRTPPKWAIPGTGPLKFYERGTQP